MREPSEMKTTKARQEQETSLPLPREGGGGSGGRSAGKVAIGLLGVYPCLQAPHTSCWWCHLLQPSTGCFLWVAFPEAACSPCRTRSGHSSTLLSLDLLPATVSPLHLSISYRATSSQDDTASVRRPILHWSLAVQVRAAVNSTYDRPSEATAFRTQQSRALLYP